VAGGWRQKVMMKSFGFHPSFLADSAAFAAREIIVRTAGTSNHFKFMRASSYNDEVYRVMAKVFGS
jgi:hypothetical protein